MKFETYSGIVVFTLMAIFVILKFSGKIEWDWFWIMSPVWIYFFASFAFLFTYLKNIARKK